MNCDNQWVQVALVTWIVIMHAFEYWLGKTDKVRASSTIDAALLGVGMLLTFINNRRKNGNGSISPK